jgi:hypothetical protein
MSGRSLRRFGAGVVAACALALTAATPAMAASTHSTGTTSDGGGWIADVPSNWNGTLLLYSHGYGTLSPQDAPDPNTEAALLNAGYALTSSDYDPNGSLGALGSAVSHQFQTPKVEKISPSRPTQVLAFGPPWGLISARGPAVQRPPDGALTTCGLVAGGIQLNNYQLDGEYAINKLLAATPPSSSTTPARPTPSSRWRSTARRPRRRPHPRARPAWRWRWHS